MDTQPVAPASAQPTEPSTPPPPSFSDLQAQWRAEDRGETVAAPEPSPAPAPREATPTEPVEAPAPAPAPEPKGVSRRQQQINEYERRIAEQEQRIRALETARTPPEATPAPPSEPEYKRYLAQPGAPKLAEFDSVEEHSAAMALFIADQRLNERQEQYQRHVAQQRAAEHFQKRNATVVEKFETARATDPEVFSKVPQEVLRAAPLSELQRGQRPTFANVAAEVALYASDPVRLLMHLHQHPEEVEAMAALGDTRSVEAALYRLDGRLGASTPASPALPQPKTVTAAPPPVETLGRKPAVPADEEAAIPAGDFSARQALWRRQDYAKRAR